MKLVNIRILFLLFGALALLPSMKAQEIKSLEDCIQIALNNNKKLELGENYIQIGKDRQTQIKANLMPKVSIEADYKYFLEQPTQLMPANAFNPMAPEWKYQAAQFGVPHNITGNLIFGMPLYHPELKAKIENAKVGVELSEIKYQQSVEDIQYDITNLYYNAKILKSKIQFIEQNIETNNQLLKTVKLIKSQGLAIGTDVDKIEFQLLQLASNKVMVKSKYNQILNGIKTLMGVDLQDNFEIQPDILFKESMTYSNQESLDEKLVSVKNKLLQGEINTINKSKLPTVVLYGSLGVSGYGYDRSPNAFLDFYSLGFVGIKAAYTIFDGNLANKQKVIKNQEINNTQLQLELIRDKINLEVANATLNMETAKENMKMIDSQVKFAKKLYDKIIFQHKEGLTSISDVLIADKDIRTAQQDYLNAIIEYFEADLKLKKISGNLFN